MLDTARDDRNGNHIERDWIDVSSPSDLGQYAEGFASMRRVIEGAPQANQRPFQRPSNAFQRGVL
jgi:hypothetical protein